MNFRGEFVNKLYIFATQARPDLIKTKANSAVIRKHYEIIKLLAGT